MGYEISALEKSQVPVSIVNLQFYNRLHSTIILLQTSNPHEISLKFDLLISRIKILHDDDVKRRLQY